MSSEVLVTRWSCRRWVPRIGHAAELIERRAVAEDRRRRALVLSPAGERAFRAAETLLRRRLGAVLPDSRPPRPRPFGPSDRHKTDTSVAALPITVGHRSAARTVTFAAGSCPRV